MNTIKDFADSFPSPTLHAVNTLTCSFQNYSSIQTKHTPQKVFVMRYRGRALPTQAKTLNFTLLLNVTPHPKIESSPFPSCLTPSRPWLQTTYWKKISAIALREILLNILLVLHIFLITSCLKKSIGIKSNSETLSSRIISPNYSPCIPHLTKKVSPLFILLVAPTMYGLPCPFLQTYRLEETL